MITINVSTTTVRRTVIKEITDTPASVFEELGVDTDNSMVTLDGGIVRGGDINKTFGELGLTDGGSTYLRSIVKADGAAE